MKGKLKPGDIFEVRVEDKELCEKYYFQYIIDDDALFGSNVIRVFDIKLACNREPNLDEVIKSKIRFHTHIMIKSGSKLGGYKKIGNYELESNLELPFFRDTDDRSVEKSYDWFAWKPNGEHVEIGELNETTKQYDVGGLFHPIDFIEWLKTDDHGFKFPN